MPKRSGILYAALALLLAVSLMYHVRELSFMLDLLLHGGAEVLAEVAQRERMNREIEIAREVQERLFPQELPGIAGLDYAGSCRPALGVGGDYYDFLALPDGKLGIAIRRRIRKRNSRGPSDGKPASVVAWANHPSIRRPRRPDGERKQACL
jgi:sigma-B regulation protein RsbU (phosphoserine phosphatase)